MVKAEEQQLYDEMFAEVADLIRERGRLLDEFARRAALAANIKPNTGMVVEFDVQDARRMLDRVDELTPRIAASMLKLNRPARVLGKHQMRWVKMEPPERVEHN